MSATSLIDYYCVSIASHAVLCFRLSRKRMENNHKEQPCVVLFAGIGLVPSLAKRGRSMTLQAYLITPPQPSFVGLSLSTLTGRVKEEVGSLSSRIPRVINKPNPLCSMTQSLLLSSPLRFQAPTESCKDGCSPVSQQNHGKGPYWRRHCITNSAQ
jgi:hypothetical protein